MSAKIRYHITVWYNNMSLDKTYRTDTYDFGNGVISFNNNGDFSERVFISANSADAIFVKRLES